MKTLPLTLIGTTLGFTILGLTAQINAATLVDIELAFILDGSSSITLSDFNTQKQAYFNIFSNNFYQDFVQPLQGKELNPELNPGEFGIGKIAVAVFQYANDVETSIDWTMIENQTDATNFGQQFLGIDKMNGLSSMGAAIQKATTSITTNDYLGTQLVFNLSSDGLYDPYIVFHPVLASELAEDAGVDVLNAIAIDDPSSDSDSDLVMLGDVTFGKNLDNNPINLFIGNNINDYESILRTKLHVETGTTAISQVPEPSLILSLVSLGILGAGIWLVKQK